MKEITPNTPTPITGKDLIALGFTPGPWFAEALEYLAETPLEGEALASCSWPSQLRSGPRQLH